MGLDKYLVTMGVKGQDVVLSTLDRIHKKGKTLSKPGFGQISLAAPKGVAGSQMPSGKEAKDAISKLKEFSKAVDKGTKTEKESEKQTKKTTEFLKQTARGAGRGVQNVGSAASSLSPVSFLKGMAALPGEALSAIPFVGGLGKAAAGAIGMATEAASGALSYAKENAAKFYSLSQRNAASAYYGGGVKFSGQEGKTDSGMGSSRAITGNYSPAERARLIAAVSGSFGKIQKPLADTLSKMIQSNKYDVGALTRVSSGDWRSSGTDTGFFIQKIADSFGDLPPSIAQKFQASLLEAYGGQEIQKSTAEQRGSQATVAAWESKDEQLAGQLYAAASKNIENLLRLNQSLNDVQVNLVNAGSKLSGVVDKVASGMNTLFDLAKNKTATNASPGKK